MHMHISHLLANTRICHSSTNILHTHLHYAHSSSSRGMCKGCTSSCRQRGHKDCKLLTQHSRGQGVSGQIRLQPMHHSRKQAACSTKPTATAHLVEHSMQMQMQCLWLFVLTMQLRGCRCEVASPLSNHELKHAGTPRLPHPAMLKHGSRAACSWRHIPKERDPRLHQNTSNTRDVGTRH